jgi:predicted metalloprotease with PDZ domain
MRRWTGVGLVGLAAAAVLGLVNAGARADDGDEKQRRVEIARFAGGGARLGVVLEDVDADDVSRLKLAEERGAVVKEVVKGSAAEKAGLQEDDVILSYQGERVGSAAQLRRLVRETPAGRRVTIEASRAGAPQRLTATLEGKDGHELLGDDSFHFEMPEMFAFNVPVPPVPPAPPIPPLDHMFDGEKGQRFFFRDRDRIFETRPGRLGLTYQKLSGQLARYFKVEDGALLVTEVETDGPAAKAGLRAGDVIVKFNGKAVTDAGDLRRTLGETPSGTEVTVTVQREGKPLEMRVSPRGEKRVHTPGATT